VWFCCKVRFPTLEPFTSSEIHQHQQHHFFPLIPIKMGRQDVSPYTHYPNLIMMMVPGHDRTLRATGISRERTFSSVAPRVPS
jgi:hypothetical protein